MEKEKNIISDSLDNNQDENQESTKKDTTPQVASRDQDIFRMMLGKDKPTQSDVPLHCAQYENHKNADRIRRWKDMLTIWQKRDI